MFNKHATFAVLASLAVSACSGSSDSGGSSGSGGSPATDAQILEPAQAASTSYGYIINTGDGTINSDATSGNIFQIQSSHRSQTSDSVAVYNRDSTYKAVVYEQGDILVIGGYELDGSGGIVGYGPYTVAPAHSGEVTFIGEYYLQTSNAYENKSFTMTADFTDNSFTGQNTLSGSTSFTVDGDISGANINGTATYRDSSGNDHSADFRGGFYEDNKVAAGFGGQTMGGVFYGKKQ